jgi:hypothetical protein
LCQRVQQHRSAGAGFAANAVKHTPNSAAVPFAM